jgi:hypothetical protein
MDIKEDIRMRLAVALMFTIVCYAGDCLASTPNVLTDQGYQSSTVKKTKSKDKKKKKASKAGKHGS